MYDGNDHGNYIYNGDHGDTDNDDFDYDDDSDDDDDDIVNDDGNTGNGHNDAMDIK